jgi:hypothetical protein
VQYVQYIRTVYPRSVYTSRTARYILVVYTTRILYPTVVVHRAELADRVDLFSYFFLYCEPTEVMPRKIHRTNSDKTQQDGGDNGARHQSVKSISILVDTVTISNSVLFCVSDDRCR